MVFINENGGNIFTDSKVTKIIIENKKVKGVELENGDSIDADLVLTSGGMFNTFYNLVGKEHLSEDFIENIDYMAIIVSHESVVFCQSWRWYSRNF